MGRPPSIAGRGIANPVADILSVAMMLDWFKPPNARALIYAAVRAVFGKKELRRYGDAWDAGYARDGRRGSAGDDQASGHNKCGMGFRSSNGHCHIGEGTA
jgi:hypothetical protein